MSKSKGVRVNATFHPTIERLTKFYAQAKGISFSEAVEKLTGKAVTAWWNSLKVKDKAEFIKASTEPETKGGKK